MQWRLVVQKQLYAGLEQQVHHIMLCLKRIIAEFCSHSHSAYINANTWRAIIHIILKIQSFLTFSAPLWRIPWSNWRYFHCTKQMSFASFIHRVSKQISKNWAIIIFSLFYRNKQLHKNSTQQKSDSTQPEKNWHKKSKLKCG